MDTTRIADLPENIVMQPGGNGNEINYNQSNQYVNTQMNASYTPVIDNTNQVRNNGGGGGGGNQYPPQLGQMSQSQLTQPQMSQTQMPLQQQQLQQQQMQQQQQMPQMLAQPQSQAQYLSDQIKLMQQQRLPSRDMPIDTTLYSQDEKIVANYIPPPATNVSSDYVRDYERTTEKNTREYEEKKNRENKMNDLFNEFQTPIFIMILFFIFQMPVVNASIFKKFAFLSITNEDGNFNFSGLLCKSILFGGIYYYVTKATNYLSEL